METFNKIFGLLYPLSLVILIVLVAIYYRKSYKQLKSNSLTILILLAAIIYFISFFVNYKLQLFMFLWFFRDLLIFVLLTRIWKLYLGYKRSFIIGILLLLIGLGYLYYRNGAFSLSKVQEQKFDSDLGAEMIFELKNKNELVKVNELLKKFNAEILQAFPQLQDTAITSLDNCYTIDVHDSSAVNLIVDTLSKSGLAEWVELNEPYSLSPIEKNSVDSSAEKVFENKVLNDTYAAKLWAFNYMDLANLNNALKKIKPVKKARIFILDTGVDSKHEDLSDNYSSLSEKYDTDTDKHGTHCAGIASAVSNNNKGIASLNLTGEFTSITSIIVLPGGSGTQESIIDGIILAADNGADVISMSLGGFSNDTRQRAYEKAIKYANDKGAIIIVAAGNENTNAKNVVPASCKGVITVSAVDDSLQKASFSNFVNDIEYKIAAPGVNIFSTIPLNQYRALNGTSMATPYVAGLVGIMKSIEPEMNTEDIYRILVASGIETKNTQMTGKFIQPLKAVSEIKTSSFNSKFRIFLKRLMTFKE